jgi:phosphoribosylformylglycinamidine synthase
MIFQEFKLERRKINLEPLNLPEDMALMDALDRVLRLPSVASKRYLTSKV